MFPSLSLCTPLSLVTTQYRSESDHELDIDANVTIQINGIVRSERPIRVFPTDLVKAQITSPMGYLGYAFYEYTIDNVPSAFGVANRNNYNPTVKIKDSKLKWFNYLNLQPEITFYQSRLQFPTLKLVGWASNFIDVEELHIILDPLNNSLNFFSKNQELVCKVVLPAGPIDYKRIVRSTPIGTYRQDLIVLGNNYKLYKILFDRRYYESQEFKPAILPFFSLNDLPFQQDIPAGGSFLDLARQKFLNKLFPIVMALDTDGNNLWIAGSDKVYQLDTNFTLLNTFTVASEEINSITCWLTGVAITTKSHKLLHVSSSGTIQLYASSMLGTPAVLDNKLIIPDSNNQRLLVFTDLSGAYNVWSTPDYIPAYAKNFGGILYVTGHDNISALKYSAADVYSKITFDRKVTLVSVVDDSIIAIHYLEDYTTLDTTGIRQIAPIRFENRKGGITHIGTKPVQVYMLGEPGIVPVAGPGITVWVNGLKNEPIGFKDYISVSYKAYTVGVMRSVVIIGDQAIDYTVEVESPKTFADNFANGQNNLNLITGPYNSNLSVSVGNIDNGTTVIPAPFSFRMYGRKYSTINVSTNGYITFGANLQTNTVPITTRLPVDALYLERDDLYQGLPLNNVNPLAIGTGALTSGETPGVFWKVNEYADATELRLKWVGTSQRFFPLGNTLPSAAAISSLPQIPMGRFNNFYINDFVSGGNIITSTRVIGKSFVNNIAKISFVDTINNRYYLRTDRPTTRYTELWFSDNYYGYVSSTVTAINVGPVILSKISARHFVLDTHVANSFIQPWSTIKCESVSIGNYHFITNPISVVENTKTFSALRPVVSNRIYVDYADTLNLYLNSTLYSTGTVPSSTRLVSTNFVLRQLSVTKTTSLSGNTTQLSFNISLLNFETPVFLKYQMLNFSGNSQYFNNQALTGSLLLTSNTSLSFFANNEIEVSAETFSFQISANLVSNITSTVLFSHNILSANILEITLPQTLSSSFTEYYLYFDKVVSSDTISTYSFKNTEVVFSLSSNDTADIQLINGTGTVYFVENYVTMANTTVSLAVNDLVSFRGNFALVDQPSSINLNDAITFKANVSSPTVSYEVGFYQDPLFQYIEINYPTTTSHISANIGISSAGNANVMLASSSSGTSYLFASYTRIGTWVYLGSGSFAEKIKEYNPRLPQVLRFSTVEPTSVRYEFVVDHKISTDSNILLATDYGYLEHNGIFYNGFGDISRIKENDLVVLTVPFNTTKRAIAPMISIGDFQFALPSVPDSIYESHVKTNVLYTNQPFSTYVTGNVSVTYSGDYFIPDYYVGPPGYKNNLVFKRIRSGSTTVLSGQTHTFLNGDIIKVEKLKTSTRKYDYRDIVIVGPESLRIAFRTNSDPLFNQLNYDLLDQPFVRAYDYYEIETNVYNDRIPLYRTANIILTSNTGSITSNLYVDTPGVNFILNGNLSATTNYLGGVSTGSNIALQRLLTNYFESNVILYQVQSDSDLSNVYIPIGTWPIQNKLIQLDAVKEVLNYSTTAIDSFMKENIEAISYALEKDFYEGTTQMAIEVLPEPIFSKLILGGVITQDFIDQITSLYNAINSDFLDNPTIITGEIVDSILIPYTINGSGEITESVLVQNHDFEYQIEDPDTPLTFTIFGGEIKDAVNDIYTQLFLPEIKNELVQYTIQNGETHPYYVDQTIEFEAWVGPEFENQYNVFSFPISQSVLANPTLPYFGYLEKKFLAETLLELVIGSQFIKVNTTTLFAAPARNIVRFTEFRSDNPKLNAIKNATFIRLDRLLNLTKHYTEIYTKFSTRKLDKPTDVLVRTNQNQLAGPAPIGFDIYASTMKEYNELLEPTISQFADLKTELLKDLDFEFLYSKDSLYSSHNTTVFDPYTPILVDRDFTFESIIVSPEIARDFISHPKAIKQEHEIDFTFQARSIGLEILDPFSKMASQTDSYNRFNFKIPGAAESLLVDLKFDNLESANSLLADLIFKTLLSVDSLMVDYDSDLLQIGDTVHNIDFDQMSSMSSVTYDYQAKFAPIPTSRVPGVTVGLQQSTDSILVDLDFKNLAPWAGVLVDKEFGFHSLISDHIIDRDFTFQSFPTSEYLDLDFGMYRAPSSMSEDITFGFQKFPSSIIPDLDFSVYSYGSSYIDNLGFKKIQTTDSISEEISFIFQTSITGLVFDIKTKFPDSNPITFSIDLKLPDENPITFNLDFLVPNSDPAVVFEINPVVVNDTPPIDMNINPMMLYQDSDALTFDSIFKFVLSQASLTRNINPFYQFDIHSLIKELEGYFDPVTYAFIGGADFIFVDNTPSLTNQLEMKFVDNTPSVNMTMGTEFVDNSPKSQIQLSSLYIDNPLQTPTEVSGLMLPSGTIDTTRFDSVVFGKTEINKRMMFYEIPEYSGIVRKITSHFDKDQAWTYSERNKFGSNQTDIYFFAKNKVWSRYEKDVTLSSVVTEGNVLYLDPPNGYIIKSVEFASFGLPLGKPGSFMVNPAAHLPDSLEIVKGLLIGRAGNIAIPVTNVIFGNIAPGVTKKLALTVTAIPQNRYQSQQYPALSNKGIVSVYDDQMLHYFTANDTMTFTGNSEVEVEVLVIGGGGGGGAGEAGTGNTQRGAGGGAGGLAVAKFKVNPGVTMNIFVGGGGRGGKHGSGGAGGEGGTNGGGNGGAAGISGSSGGGGGGGGWSGISIGGSYMVVAGGGAGGGGSFEGIANDLPASGGGNQIGGQNVGTMFGGIGSSFAGISIQGTGTKIFSLKDPGLAGPPNFTAYEPAYGDFLIEQGVWEAETGDPNFTRTYTVNFPANGYYLFAGSVDDSGNVFLDGTRVLQLIDYAIANLATVMVTAGNHTVEIIAQNAAGVGSVGLTIETAVMDGGGGGGGGGGYVGGTGQSLLGKKRASGGQNFISNVAQGVTLLNGNDGGLPIGGPSVDYDFIGYHSGSNLYEGVSYTFAGNLLMAGSAFGGGHGGRGGDLVQGTITGHGEDGARGLVIVKYTKPKVYSDFVFYQQNYNYDRGSFSTYALAADEARKFVSSTPFVIPGTNYWNHRIFFNTHIYAVPAKPDAYFYEDYVPGLYANLAVAARTSTVRFLVQSQDLVDNTLLPYTITSTANLQALSPNTSVNGNLTIRSNRAYLDMRFINDSGTTDDIVTLNVDGQGCLANANITITVKANGQSAGSSLYGFSNCNVLTGNIGLPAITGRPVELPNFFSNDSQIKMPEFKVDTANDYGRYAYYLTRDSSAPLASRQTHEQEIEEYSYRASNIKISNWTVGATSVPGYNFNQTVPGENVLVADVDPWSRISTVWQSQPSGDGNNDGGWNGDYFPIDPNKLYRSSVWVRRITETGAGTVYHGLYSNGSHLAYPNGYSSVGNIRRLNDGLAEWNPYWSYRPAYEYTQGIWHLHVGFVFPATHTGNIAHPDSGIYTRRSGLVMSNQGNINDGKFPANATQAMQRVYHFYCNDQTTKIQFAFPRFEEVTQYTTSINLLLDYGPYEIPQLKNEAPNKYVVARRKTWPIMWNTRGG